MSIFNESDVKDFRKILYYLVEECGDELKEYDDSIKKENLDFCTLLANHSESTGIVSKTGKDIRLSYVSWHDMFIASKDRNNEGYFLELCCCSGAMCYTKYN